MRLRECSASKLNRLSHKRKLIFVGAGNNMFHILKVYGEYEFEKRLAFVIDQSPHKIGTKLSFGGSEVEIKPYAYLRDINLREYTLVITALCHREIFPQIQRISNPKGFFCYKAPNRNIGGSRLLQKLACALPLKDIIVLNGEGDTCENALALGEYIRGKDYFGKYRLVWLCDHPENFRNTDKERYFHRKTPMYAKGLRELLEYYLCIARARYIIFENQLLPKMRKKQITVYMNHGSPPIKSTKGIINLPEDLDIAISPSQFSTKIISEQYGIEEERIRCCGSPRTDRLFDLRDVEEIKADLGIAGFDRIILWVPTFRQHKNSNRIDTNAAYKLGIPIIDSIAAFEEFLSLLRKNNILVLLKPHFLQDMDYLRLHTTANFRIMTNGELEDHVKTVYDLMKCADAMLTDYSTIAFDFMLLDRPIGYTLDDRNEYRVGFSIEHIEELMPGEQIYALAQLHEFVRDVKEGKDLYRTERSYVNLMVHDYPDACNARRLCRILGLEKEK